MLDDETLNINLWCTLNRYLLKSGLKLLLLFCPSWTLKRCRSCDKYSFCVLWMPQPYLQPNLPPGGIGQCNPAMCYWPNPPSSPHFAVAANLNSTQASSVPCYTSWRLFTIFDLWSNYRKSFVHCLYFRMNSCPNSSRMYKLKSSLTAWECSSKAVAVKWRNPTKKANRSGHKFK